MAWDADDPRVVPIAATTAHFARKKFGLKALSRTNFPLSLAWCTTIHRAQGATFDRCCVNLGDRELSLGLSYVALSRVKPASSLLSMNIMGKLFMESRELVVVRNRECVNVQSKKPWIGG